MSDEGSESRTHFSARARILAWILLVVMLASLVTVLITGRVLFSMVDARATAELAHEAEKFHAFANSGDPATGLPFDSPDELLDSYLTHSVPESSETLFSLIGGSPHLRSRGTPPVRLDADPVFVAAVAAERAPVHGHLATSAGPVTYAVIPVMSSETASSGTGSSTGSDGALVIAEFLGPAHDQVWSTLTVMSVISLLALGIAGATGWVVAGRVLAPIRDVRVTAEAIGESDLARRIVVRGNDDVAQLATTFNRMLDRVQGAFDGQRRFLDDVGHELRTPITIIRGHLDVMGDDQAEREETLRLVDDELKRMSRLVDDLVLLARSERPDFVVPGRVILSDLVVDTLTKATALAERTWQIAAISDRTVVADGQRLTQALLQLVANAVKHTDHGDTIAIGSAVEGDQVRLWVSDTGKGIPESDRERVFRRFERGSKESGIAGSGVGLAIVARIAEAHGGSARVDSSVSSGATVTIELPLVEPASEVRK